MNPVVGWVRRHRLASFFLLAFAVSWAPWPAYAAGALPEPMFLPFGPLLAAVVVLAIADGSSGLRQLAARMLRWRVGWHWYLVAVGLPVAVLAAAALTNSLIWDASGLAPGDLAWGTVATTFAVRLVNPLDGPMGEEPGWRGYALPELRRRRTLLESAVALGLAVAAWHLPLVAMDQLPLLGLPTTFAITFVYCWLFDRTDGSVLLTLIFHAAQGSIQIEDLGWSGAALTRMDVLTCVAWTLVAVIVILVDRRRWLAPPLTAAARTTPAAV